MKFFSTRTAHQLSQTFDENFLRIIRSPTALLIGLGAIGLAMGTYDFIKDREYEHKDLEDNNSLPNNNLPRP